MDIWKPLSNAAMRKGCCWLEWSLFNSYLLPHRCIGLHLVHLSLPNTPTQSPTSLALSSPDIVVRLSWQHACGLCTIFPGFTSEHEPHRYKSHPGSRRLCNRGFLGRSIGSGWSTFEWALSAVQVKSFVGGVTQILWASRSSPLGHRRFKYHSLYPWKRLREIARMAFVSQKGSPLARLCLQSTIKSQGYKDKFCNLSTDCLVFPYSVHVNINTTGLCLAGLALPICVYICQSASAKP